MIDLTHNGKVLFSHNELACKKTGEVRLVNGFSSALISLRVAYDRPLYPSSCCRSFLHNEAVGGHPQSLHVYDEPFHPVDGTCAIDFEITDSLDRFRLIALATSMYWSIGIAGGFIHLDMRQLAGLTSGVAFVY